MFRTEIMWPGLRNLIANRVSYTRSSLISSLLLAVLVMLIASPASAFEWSWRKHIDLDLLYEGGYNSNILELSPDDIDRFVDNDLTLATDIESYDDLQQTIGLRLHIEGEDWWGWRDASLSYTINYVTYLNNQYNNRMIHNAFLSTDVVERMDIFGSWLYIPNRFLRDYYDRDFGEVIGTYFEYDLLGGGMAWSPKALSGLRLTGRYEYFTIYYNKFFTEYDSEGWGLRLDARYRFHSDLSITATIKRRWADNIGFDQGSALAQDDPAFVDAEYGDGTYGEEWYELVVDYDIDNVLPDREIDIELSTRLRHRFYTTDRSLEDDPIHAGRSHNHWRFAGSADTRVVEGLYAGPVIEYEFRRTDSPLDWVIDSKDFETWRVMLVVSYDLW